MDVAVGVSNFVLVPLTLAPVVQGMSSVLKSIRPEYRLEKWALRIEAIVTAVAAKEDIIPSKAMGMFFQFVEDYIKARCIYEEQVKSGKKSMWSWRGHKDHSSCARYAWMNGVRISMYASIMKQKCSLEHKNRLRNAQGKCSECFPDNYIATRYQSRFPTEESPLTWSFLFQSVLNLSTLRTEDNSHGIVLEAGTEPTPSPDIVHLERGHSDIPPPSYMLPLQPEDIVLEVNNSSSTTTMDHSLGNDSPECCVPELSMPLDMEENHIVSEVMRQKFTSLGFSCEDLRAWQSLANDCDAWTRST